MMGERKDITDTRVRTYLGYTFNTADSVKVWRHEKLSKVTT